jgi:serine/threonine protein kinase
MQQLRRMQKRGLKSKILQRPSLYSPGDFMGLFDMFKKNEQAQAQPQRDQQSPAAQVETSREYKKGDLIGNKYQVYDVLGKGGCGIVYLAFCTESGSVYALKSFLDKFNTNIAIRDRFKKEALVWVSLGRHPFIVNARLVDEISGRLFIATEFIAPSENGLNSLDSYLEKQPPDIEQSLLWAIQFCHGMEYAYSKGIKAHRDIKPANILIDADKNIKISDFGLAGVVDSNTISGFSAGNDAEGMQTAFGTGMGTPTHMPPEQFINAAECDERSDIYSFGIVLYQLVNNGRLPFYTENRSQFWQIMHHLHGNTPVPASDSKLSPIIIKCLEKNPNWRFKTFADLRNELQSMYSHLTGKYVVVPEVGEMNASDWNNKGVSLDKIGKTDQALECYEKVIALNPKHFNALNNKGLIYIKQNNFDKAIECFDKSLELSGAHELALANKAMALEFKGKLDDAIRHYVQSIKLNPHFFTAWTNLSACQFKAGYYREALISADTSLKISPEYASAWNNKGLILYNLDRDQEAFVCFYKAIQLDPLNIAAFENVAMMSCDLGRHDKAIDFYNGILAINPTHMNAWIKKAQILVVLERLDEALWCYGKATEINLHSLEAWIGCADIFWKKDDLKQAFNSYHNALLIDPDNIHALCQQGEIYLLANSYEDALERFEAALSVDDSSADAWLGKSHALGDLGRDDEAEDAYYRYEELKSPDEETADEELFNELVKLSKGLNAAKTTNNS